MYVHTVGTNRTMASAVAANWVANATLLLTSRSKLARTSRASRASNTTPMGDMPARPVPDVTHREPRRTRCCGSRGWPRVDEGPSLGVLSWGAGCGVAEAYKGGGSMRASICNPRLKRVGRVHRATGARLELHAAVRAQSSSALQPLTVEPLFHVTTVQEDRQQLSTLPPCKQ